MTFSFRQFLFAIAAVFLLAFVPLAQDRSKEIVEQGWGVPDEPFNCEMNSLYLDILGNVLPEKTQNGNVLIIVARLGRGEISRSFNRRRLHNALQYQIERIKIAPEKVILTEGKRVVDGFGRLEFYLNGKMAGSLLVARNRDLCVHCCENQGSDYYPDKSRVDNKPNKKKKR
jgi:hypothetical protein